MSTTWCTERYSAPKSVEVFGRDEHQLLPVTRSVRASALKLALPVCRRARHTLNSLQDGSCCQSRAPLVTALRGRRILPPWESADEEGVCMTAVSLVCRSHVCSSSPRSRDLRQPERFTPSKLQNRHPFPPPLELISVGLSGKRLTPTNEPTWQPDGRFRLPAGRC